MSSANSSDSLADNTVEYDENGVPYYKWPPFPTPLPGANIIPFRDFKPSGIQIQVMEGEVEFDGVGIQTVRLNVKHDGENRPKKKKAKKQLTTEEAANTGEWWRDWEAGEDLRSNFNYDDMLPMGDRLVIAAEDFKRSRKWPPQARKVEFWWDTFQLFCGTIGYDARPIIKKFKDEDEAMDEDDSTDEDPSGPRFSGSQSPQPVDIQDYDPARHHIRTTPVFVENEEELQAKRLRNFEEKEKRLDNFLRNPEISTKIFFSSYFREKGWMWESAALRDCPHVVHFFLRFLIRNRALPEIRRELTSAVAIAERAQEELPRTKVISMSIPDEFGLSCSHLFGSREPKTDWSTALRCLASDNTEMSDTENSSAKENGPDIGVGDGLAPPKPVDEEMNGLDATDWGAPSDNTWGNPDGWGDPLTEAAEPASKQTVDPWARPVHFLMNLLGPISLPLSHKVGYVERSTRYIISCTMPADANEADRQPNHVIGSLAKVVFGAHRKFFNHDRAAIKRPELLEDPFTDKELGMGLSRHDPGRDQISVYLLPEAAETLIPKMNINAIFVQVVPDRSWDKSRSGDSPQRCDEAFWYIEKVEQVLPSFWFERR